MFINFSNHPSEGWAMEQKKNAIEMGEKIVDISFPNVKPEFTEKQIYDLAQEYAKRICDMKPDVVMCQGEITLCYSIITLLKQNGIKVVAATTKRETQEIKKGDCVQKISLFKFFGFREYVV